jgi:predicted DsbA family dithiol-disulfide isomerase
MIRPLIGVGTYVKVEIWSDVVCPWCYIGKRRFESALADFEHGAEVEVAWRSFELDPAAPALREGSYARRLGLKYGVSPGEAQAMIDRMTTTAAGVGLDFRLDLARPGNTFDAHRLLHLAADRDCQDRLKERLLVATFTDGEPIGDRRVLLRLCVEVGLDEDEVRTVLESDAYADDVRNDEAQATDLGISGVPFFVIDRTFAVSGAQPSEVMGNALERAWTKTHPQTVIVTGEVDGQGCEGDTCAV